MTLTVRLEPELEQRFVQACARRRHTRSEVVTQLIEQFLQAEEQVSLSPAELARKHGLIGSFSGPSDLATQAGDYIRERLGAKNPG